MTPERTKTKLLLSLAKWKVDRLLEAKEKPFKIPLKIVREAYKQGLRFN